MVKTAVILRGPCGSGKSSYVDTLCKQGEAMVVSADEFFMKDGLVADDSYQYPKDGDPLMVPGKVYDFDVKKLQEAHAECLTKFILALREGIRTVIVDNTNTRHWEYMAYIQAARLADYQIRIVEFPVKTIEQIRRCARRGKHVTDPEIVARQALRWEDFDADETREV